MAGLAELAAQLSFIAASVGHSGPPLDFLDAQRLHYDVRIVDDSTGLGGYPPYCGPPNADVLMVSYVVRNDGEAGRATPAVPIILLTDPDGNTVRPDLAMTRMVAAKANPTLEFRNGILQPHESKVLAEVFLLPRGDLHRRQYYMHLDLAGATARKLPPSTPVETPACPPPPKTVFIAPNTPDQQ
jgi:hypothetical protein